MISLQLPHMGLNSHNAPAIVRMARTHSIKSSTTVDQMIQLICNYAH